MLNKTIAYTYSWSKTFKIATIIGVFIVLILIFLGPFGTSEDNFSHKNLKLAGYGLCVIIPILITHALENYIFIKQKRRWFILNEIVYLTLVLFIAFLLCFLYHFYAIGSRDDLEFDFLLGFIKTFGVPFLPLIIPIWAYLRSKFGIIELPQKGGVKNENVVTIKGESKSENLIINEANFVYAQAQQNYVIIHYNTENKIEQKIIRSTLSNIIKQLPNAWQVHRSYLVNLQYLKSVEGNARKRFMTISSGNEPIPVSQKYYDALKKRLSKSSHSFQN